MKAVRGLLSQNMELARNGLVSKSNVENVRFPWSLLWVDVERAQSLMQLMIGNVLVPSSV